MKSSDEESIMEPFTRHPTYLTQQQSRLFASRQMLTFLFVPEGPDTDDPFEDLFSVDSLPENAFTDDHELFNWKSRTIYDVDGLELFHDHSIELGSENEITVRVASSERLGTPVWSVSSGRKYVDRLTEKTLAFISSKPELDPVSGPGKPKVMIVCYSYPKLGILCRSGKAKERVVVDLADPIIIPVDRPEEPKYPSLKTVWSPYDKVTRGRIGFNRWFWHRKVASLPEWKVTRENLRPQVIMFMQSVVKKHTEPKLSLVGQQTDFYCAPATAHMILKQHGQDISQNDIADIMGTDPGFGSGLQAQEDAIAALTGGSLEGDLDHSETFAKAKSEIDANRPFKSGTVTDHARACGGYKLAGDTRSLRVFDPWPSNQGEVRWEDWDAGIHENFMYVTDA